MLHCTDVHANQLTAPVTPYTTVLCHHRHVIMLHVIACKWIK